MMDALKNKLRLVKAILTDQAVAYNVNIVDGKVSGRDGRTLFIDSCSMRKVRGNDALR